jgi:hypothetical protein
VANALHTVVETPEFLHRARRLFTDEERRRLVVHLAAHPMAGEPIPGTGGARKLRWAIGSRGKSGGTRVITFYSGTSVPVFLLSVFGKNEKADLTPGERNELRAILSELVDEYRRGAGGRVKGRG